VDKHNKHQKNKDKGVKKPQSPPENSAVLPEPLPVKKEAVVTPGQKPNAPTGKRK
jgi:hypothetical protein